jgi:DtxR family Mn-dependent transcriptional regulator
MEHFSKLTSALEDYIETIALLKKKKKYARIGDIAKELEIKSSSVNVAVKFLVEIGLVIHENYGYVDLTAEGEKVAQEVQRKHDSLYQFLTEVLFVDSELALKEACEIEHSVSSDTICRLEKLFLFLKEHILDKKIKVKKLQSYLNI